MTNKFRLVGELIYAIHFYPIPIKFRFFDAYLENFIKSITYPIDKSTNIC